MLLALVRENAELGNKEKAMMHMQDLYETRDRYFDFLDSSEGRHCLMFIEGDTDGFWDSTREDINERVAMAEKAIKQFN